MNQNYRKIMDELGGQYSTDRKEKYIYACAAMVKMLGYEQFKYLIDRYAVLEEFREEALDSVKGDAEKEEILNFLFGFIPSRVRDTLRMRMIFMDLTEDDIHEIVVQGLLNEEAIRKDPSSESIESLVMALLQKVAGTSFVDYCSGQGNMLFRVWEDKIATELYGQEIDIINYYISKIRMIAAGADNFYIEQGDVLVNPILVAENGEFKKVDKAFSQFPLGLRVPDLKLHPALDYPNDSEATESLKRRPDFAFIRLLTASIKETGKAITVIPSGLLSNAIDQRYRKCLFETGMVEGIIKIVNNLIPTTSMDLSILILSHSNKEVRMVDATEIHTKGRRTNELSTKNIERIVSLYNGQDDAKESLTVSNQEILENQYNLEPYNYLISNQIEILFPEQMDKITEKMFRGVQIKASDLDEMITEKSDYQLVSLKDIENGRICSELINIKVDDDKKYRRYYLEDGDLLMTAKGTVVKTAVVSLTENQKLIVTGNLLAIRLRKNLVNPVYLKVFLDSEDGRKILKTVQAGTRLISISTGALKELTVSLPPMEDQEKIAEEYNSRQEKIEELSKQLNELKNEMAGIYESVTRELRNN